MLLLKELIRRVFYKFRIFLGNEFEKINRGKTACIFIDASVSSAFDCCVFCKGLYDA
jgi:hypothetical protein